MSLLIRRQTSARAEEGGSLASLFHGRSVETVLRSVRIDGQISAHEDIEIDGDIIGPITSDSKVTIGPNGIIHGGIKARHIVIFGRVEGDIEATERVALEAGADVRGDISTIYISLDENAYFKGSVGCSSPDTKLLPFSPSRESGSSAREPLSA